jgi:hypothetical protein
VRTSPERAAVWETPALIFVPEYKNLRRAHREIDYRNCASTENQFLHDWLHWQDISDFKPMLTQFVVRGVGIVRYLIQRRVVYH